MGRESREKLQATVEHIVYENEENGFTVARVSPIDRFEKTITVVGNLPSVFPGQQLSLEGGWDRHPKYGRQFKADHCSIELPATEAGIEQYLSSRLIKGIGPVIAERITDRFGTEALRVIDREPEKLKEIEGIGAHRLEGIKDGWDEGEEIRNIMIFLKEHGVSTAYAVKIYQQYGKNTVDVLREDPYQLARDVYGIGFKTADRIAQKMGLGERDKVRLKAGIEYALQNATDEGHLYLPREELYRESRNLLDTDSSLIREALRELLQEERVVEEKALGEGDPTYLASLYYAEIGVANRIGQLAESQRKEIAADAEKRVEKFLDRYPIEYNQQQRRAIEEALKGQIIVITGGPGTGKTTTVKGIIDLMQEMNQAVSLAAPTGRAAKRLGEATGREAYTLHRLLGYKPPNEFEHGPDNKLRDRKSVV